MLNESLAGRYSTALYASAKTGGSGQTLTQFKELQIIAAALRTHAGLKKSLNSPTVARAVKKEIIKAVFKDQISQRTLNFWSVLIDKGREPYYEDIVECYKKQLCEDNGIVEAKVESAAELDDQMRMFIELKLSKISGRRVKMIVDVRPELIGGLVIRLGERLYDGSIKRHIENMRSRMLNAET